MRGVYPALHYGVIRSHKQLTSSCITWMECVYPAAFCRCSMTRILCGLFWRIKGQSRGFREQLALSQEVKQNSRESVKSDTPTLWVTAQKPRLFLCDSQHRGHAFFSVTNSTGAMPSSLWRTAQGPCFFLCDWQHRGHAFFSVTHSTGAMPFSL